MTINDDPNLDADFLVMSEQGEPIGVFNPQQIIDEGTKFAFDLAAVCDSPILVKQVQQKTLERVGSEMFGYVCANALDVMTEHILAPSFELAKAYGTDLQAGMAAIAKGEHP